MTNIKEIQAKSILTAQKGGFLSSDPYPFSHSMSVYTGCEYGTSPCGTYCYAQMQPNWMHLEGQPVWGSLVLAKTNASVLLQEELKRHKNHSALRIFFASLSDPWMPTAESQYQITRQCLEIFSEYTDLGLLVLQTRSPLAVRDVDIIKHIPYAYLSITLETDQSEVLKKIGRGGPTLEARWGLIDKVVAVGIPVQIVISPCLPYSKNFAHRLINSGANRFVVDNFVEGDGSRGVRTGQSAFAAIAWYNWKEDANPLMLYKQLQEQGAQVGWSSEGFCSIPSFENTQMLF